MPLALSYILLSEEAEPIEADIRSFLKTSWPDLLPAVNFSKADHTLAFSVGPTEIALGVMPTPIPWTDLEGPCATSVLWPEAEMVVKTHQAHIIVTVAGDLSPVELSNILTQATAAVMSATEAAPGVYWETQRCCYQR